MGRLSRPSTTYLILRKAELMLGVSFNMLKRHSERTYGLSESEGGRYINLPRLLPQVSSTITPQ
jgi:hypothetical protein